MSGAQAGRRRRWVAAGLVAALAITLAGCGDSDEPIQAAAAAVGAAAPGEQAAAKAATQLTVAPARTSVAFGSAATVTVTLTANAAPAAGQRVQVAAGDAAVSGTTGADGAATVDLPVLPAGRQEITATYAGNDTALPATATGSVTVDPAATTLALTLTPLPSGAATAAVALTSATGVPVTGSVTFAVNGAPLGPVPVAANAAAVEIPAAMGIGDHAIIAAFVPDNPAQLTAAQAAGTVSITKAPVTVAVTGRETVRYGDWTSVDVTVQSAAGGDAAAIDLSGPVALTDASGAVLADGATDAAGHASLEFLVRADPGPITYTVSYGGTDVTDAGQAQLAQQITQTNVDLAIDYPDTVKPGDVPRISLSVIGTPDTPTGTAVIAVDGTEIAAGQLSDGSISGTAPALAAGEHTISVRYGGDARFEANEASATITAAEPPANPNAAGAAGLQASNPCPASADACIDLSNERAWLQSGGEITYGPVPITSGMAGYRTRTGTFSVFFKNRDHRSSLFDDAPMPNSVFFDGDIAFHAGSLSEQSHGCIHLSYAASEVFFDALGLGETVVAWGAAPY